MSAHSKTQRLPVVASPPNLSGLFRRIARANARYRSRRQLRDLDARLLRDIGVSEADIDAEMRRSIWR